MLKKIFLVWTVVFFMVSRNSNGQVGPIYESRVGNISGRDVKNLDGKWQVILDWYGSGNATAIANNKQATGKNDFTEFSFDNSQTLSVPGDWNSQRAELKYYEGTVWYKRDFVYQKKKGKRTYLHFAGVSYRCDVFLNGEHIGGHEGSFTPFQFEITDKIKNGRNLLVVKVNNERREDAIPARKFDWWNYGGITRSVAIAETPDHYIADYFVQLKKGSLKQVQGWLQLSDKRQEKVVLEIPEAHVKKTIVTDTSGRAIIDFPVRLKLWSPQQPKLYLVRIETMVDTVEDRIGFRSIEVKGADILLNGRPVFLRGISFHEEIPQRAGRAYSETDSKQLLSWAKELGCNFVRLAHYPQSEQTVKLAEQMGMMMWEEIPVWQGIQFSNTEILGKAKKMLHEMIERDKNRCGIIIWSLSNETAPSKARDETLTIMAGDARRADPTRLISSAFDHFKYNKNEIIIEDALSKSLDVLAVNKYMGWYAPWPAEPGNVIWKSNFNKPIIVSEFGSEALYGNHGPKDTAGLWTEEHQEQLYKDNILMFQNMPLLRGICPWILADFRSPARMQAQFQEGWNRKGLLSDKGFKKKAWYVIYDYYNALKQREKEKRLSENRN